MQQKEIFEQLQNPELFGQNVSSVKILQTHISFVVLTGSFAYKIKKAIDFGFLDFSTLEKRKFFCEEEIKLNKRLCPKIYLSVVPITEHNGKIQLNGKGKIVEYALKMKEFPQENIMTNQLNKGNVTAKTIEEICDILVNFYKSNKGESEIESYGKAESVKKNIDENFEQTKSVINTTIPRATFDFIKDAANQFFEKNSSIFEKRIKEGHICDCHGDLHSGNIVILDNICIFDCIEFNKRFRYCDVASDISFLAMDLDYLNYPELSSYLIQNYIQKSSDKSILQVLNFYKSYRAYVRGKVNGFKLSDPNIKDTEKKEIIDISKKYFELSYYYAQLFSLDLNHPKPIIFLVCGMSGTGKSTLAQKLSIDYNATHLNTDIIRKEIEGINIFEKHLDEINTGLYSPEKIEKTYRKLIEKSEEFVKDKKNVILDATFSKKKFRKLVYDTFKKYDAALVVIECISRDDIVKKWLDKRIKTKSVSDGRWEVYLHQKKTFEKLTDDENSIVFDTSKESYDYRLGFFKKIIEKINEDG